MFSLKRPALDPSLVEPTQGSQPPHYPPPHDHLLDERRKRRLGDALGLTDFGVNLVELPPGTVSSLRHWHSHEDEFVYVLRGEVTLVTDAGEQILGPGMAAGFPKNVADGHHLKNTGPDTAVFLEVGSRHPEDIAEYSDVDLKTCRQVIFTDKRGEPVR
jgi:uncharacterized cupin superfamily protein